MPIREAIRDQMSKYGGGSLRADNRPYLTYYGVRLTREDMACLKNDWLTDNNITFWQEYLEHVELARHPESAVILLRPSMMMLLKMHVEPAELKSILPNLRDASHVFLPITDSTNREQPEGGTHWSLLVVGIADRIAFHYDSLGGANFAHAQMVHQQLQLLLGFQLQLANLDDTPQQDNGRDCGVHVCWAMKHLLVRRLLVVERQREVDMSLGGKRLDAARMRREMYRTCESLRKKASRS